MQLNHIEKALSHGHRLHAFRSGGGLRVVRVSDSEGITSGYGEHPHIDDALAHANLDLERGTRPYNELYGVRHPFFLTGSAKASSPLDAWLLKWSKFDIRKVGDEFVFELDGHEIFQLPDEIKARISAGEQHVSWNCSRGYKYKATSTTRADGEKSISTEVLWSPKTHHAEAFMWRIKKTGQAPKLWDALEKAWEASPVEQF